MPRILSLRLGALGALGALVLLSGCRFDYLHDDLNRMRRMGEVRGELTVEGWQGDPLMIAILVKPESPSDPIRVVRDAYLEHPGHFVFRLDPGEYLLVALEDSNRNRQVDDGERGAVLEPFTLAQRQRGSAHDIHIAGPFPRRTVGARTEVHDERPYRIGDLAPLEHERFSQRAGTLGLWQPMVMLDRYQPGLWLLAPHDPAKTPVVFVHGMGGYPQEFQALIESLDSNRFEPWVFNYPSGLRLGTLGRFMSEALTEMHVAHQFERTCVVAHSMGGVVSRRALSHHGESQPTPFIHGFVTIASPLGGIASAESGVDMAPEVVPAWRDLVPNGVFMRRLYAKPLPSTTEYQLLFTYEESGPDDGVVPMQSQLRREAQREAEVVRGFEATHVGALSNERVLRQVNLALDRCRGDRPGAPLVADRRRRRHPGPTPPANGARNTEDETAPQNGAPSENEDTANDR